MLLMNIRLLLSLKSSIMFDGNLIKMIGGNYNVVELLSSFANAGIYHFIFMSCIVIFIKFNKKINIKEISQNP